MSKIIMAKSISDEGNFPNPNGTSLREVENVMDPAENVWIRDTWMHRQS